MSYKIKFGTDGWRAIIADTYTFDNIERVAEATAKWLLKKSDSPKLLLGYDCRFLADKFAEKVANVMAHNGIKVFLTPGFVSTPALALATTQKQADAGIILTASHNPYTYGGYKVKAHYGGPTTPEEITEIEKLIPENPPKYEDKFLEFAKSKQIEFYDAEALYINYIRDTFDVKKIADGKFKIGYDAMFGAGQRIFKKLFPKALTLHCEHNPLFGKTPPEPIERNLKEYQEFVKKNNIHFGLATDGDADRIGLFDQNGHFIDSHHVILLLIHYLHKYKKKKGKVVISFSSTTKAKKMCELYGLPYTIVPVGFKHIIKELLKEKNWLLGAEESGGMAIQGHIPERDGIYTGLVILEMMQELDKDLPALIEEIHSVVGAFDVQRNDLHLPEEKKREIVENCKQNRYDSFGEYKILEVETIDGFKFHFKDEEWVMIRPSGTEPVLRIYAQGKSREDAFKILEATKNTILQ